VGSHWLDLWVNEHTLIPRAETEVLVETALKKIARDANVQVLDLGTGSGAIALAIGKERQHASVLAVDQSESTLQVAKHNAVQNQISNVSFLRADWFSTIDATQQFDVIVSNPPYVAEGDPHLQQGDLRFEPPAALSSGKDGLDDIRHIVEHAPHYLKRGGWLMLEHGRDQAAQIQQLMSARGFIDVSTEQDLERRDRVTIGRSIQD
jgi:release factor glutamine methyltransferase